MHCEADWRAVEPSCCNSRVELNIWPHSDTGLDCITPKWLYVNSLILPHSHTPNWEPSQAAWVLIRFGQSRRIRTGWVVSSLVLFNNCVPTETRPPGGHCVSLITGENLAHHDVTEWQTETERHLNCILKLRSLYLSLSPRQVGIILGDLQQKVVEQIWQLKPYKLLSGDLPDQKMINCFLVEVDLEIK